MTASVGFGFFWGFLLLMAGGEALVRGSSALATRLGVSRLVIGLTVVAFGTSAPELVVSAVASLEGKREIAFGNVVGSNIFNVLGVLGLCAVVRPLVVDQQLVRRDVPLLAALSFLLWVLVLDSRLGALEGAALLSGLVAFTVYSVRESRRETALVRQQYEESVAVRAAPAAGAAWISLLWVIAGVVLMVFGARSLVAAAVATAAFFDIGESVVALTIVAVGTGLPEAFASLVATLRGQRDIAVGNIVGSSIFNLLGILGVSAIAAPGGLGVDAAVVAFDVPVMAASSLVCLPLFASGHLLSRWEGALFLSYYTAYVAYLAAGASDHAELAPAALRFALVATTVALGVVALRWRRDVVAARARRSEQEPQEKESEGSP